jgi:hypothetical protein
LNHKKEKKGESTPCIYLEHIIFDNHFGVDIQFSGVIDTIETLEKICLGGPVFIHTGYFAIDDRTWPAAPWPCPVWNPTSTVAG